jgi:ribonuclease Z
VEFTFLGTGAALPSRQRNVSSLAVRFLADRSETWLFDCGEGTQQQILQSAIKPSKITNIFISHLHGDHIFGLPGLLSTRSVQGATTPLILYGPAGLEAFVQTSLQVSGAHLRYPLDIVTIHDGMIQPFAQGQLTIRKLAHGIPSYGFRLQQADRPGKLDQMRLASLGVPPGPHYQALKRGETITLDDGRQIDGRAFLAPPQRGLSFVYLGDTRPTPAAVALATQADLLIHEATFGVTLADKAAEHFHSTTVEAAQIAVQADVGQLILTHLSSRYQETDEAALLAEATTIFPRTLLAQDFSTFSLVERNLS